MQQALTELSGALRHPLNVNRALPQRLYYPTDAHGLAATVRGQALRALDWRLGWGDPLVRYGVDLVEEFLDQHQCAAADPLREEFRGAARANFSPRGTHFDGFVARLFACPDAGQATSTSGYALGFSVENMTACAGAGHPDLGIRLEAAIYSREQQLAIVGRLYQSYEDYFVAAVQRFGQRHRDDLLIPCWDKFRHDIGSVLMRFRDPALGKEREWIALAVGRRTRTDDGIGFEIVDNRLVPAVALDIGARLDGARRPSALDVIVIGASLPFEPTREVLQAFLARHAAARVRIHRAC